MSFRRDTERTRTWIAWLSAHRSELAATGVPHGIYEHEHSWFHFLEHGVFPGEGSIPRFDLAELSPAEKQRLLVFLRAHAQLEHSDAERYLQRLLTTSSTTRNT